MIIIIKIPFLKLFLVLTFADILSMELKEFYLKDKSSITWTKVLSITAFIISLSTGYLGRTSSTAIAVVSLDGEHRLLANLHRGHPQVPAFDHLRLAQVEAEPVPPVTTGVKLGAVCEGADIVNKHLVSCPGGGSSFTRHLEIMAYFPESRPSSRSFFFTRISFRIPPSFSMVISSASGPTV